MRRMRDGFNDHAMPQTVLRAKKPWEHDVAEEPDMALDGSRQGTQNVGGRTMGDRSIAYSSLKMSNHKYNPLHRTRTKCEIIGRFTVATSAAAADIHRSLTSYHHLPPPTGGFPTL